MRFGRAIWALCLALGGVAALDNGLALTPPMGWLAWERFRCITDCTADPDNCISEKLFKDISDALVNEGYADAGYNYVNIDDCWPAWTRDNGKLVANSTRFPSGIAALSRYVHSKGLKLGIYEDFGTNTCGGYPGVCADEECTNSGYMQTDANTFASWEVDSLKLDGCYSVHTRAVLDVGYANMTRFLNESGRSILYSCSWPAYLTTESISPDYQLIAKQCNLWRMWDDIQDSWDSVVSIVDYMGDNQDAMVPAAGPGHWNDPDMLIIGNYGLSYEQAKAQMALWSIMAAPLLMGNDPRDVAPEMKAILLNKKVIAVDQDVLGKQGRRVVHDSDTHDIWVRELANGHYAVVLWNRSIGGTHSNLTVTWEQIGIPSQQDAFEVEELFTNEQFGKYTSSFSTFVNPSGGVAMLRLTPASQ